MIEPQLAGKTALVTGANHGIGATIAQALTIQGVSVFSHIFGPIINHNIDSACFECDLAIPENIPLLLDKAESKLGQIDILINNASSWAADSFLPIEDTTSDRIGRSLSTISAQSIDLHFNMIAKGSALLMSDYARRRSQGNFGWGRIVNISTSGAYCFPEEVSYGAAKFAVESYSRSAAKELGRFGITVNVVSPGAIQTGWINPDFELKIAADTPLGRVGQPDDIADVVVFLCSHQARWITGQLIHVGGGSMM